MGKPVDEERARKAAAIENGKYVVGLSRKEIRLRYLKKRHEMVKLKRQFPEVDFDGAERTTCWGR